MTKCSITNKTKIISWNVASWPRTVEQIRKVYGIQNETQNKNVDPLEFFLKMTDSTMICLQETKIPYKRVCDEPYRSGASKKNFDSLDGWETYWAGSPKSGMNGVATYVRSGLTLAADSAPLSDPELNSEGRCLLTVHQNFALFNIYAPHARTQERGEVKDKFFSNLLCAIKRVKETYSVKIKFGDRFELRPIPVIIAGDFNLTLWLEGGQHWTLRHLSKKFFSEGLAAAEFFDEMREMLEGEAARFDKVPLQLKRRCLLMRLVHCETLQDCIRVARESGTSMCLSALHNPNTYRAAAGAKRGRPNQGSPAYTSFQQSTPDDSVPPIEAFIKEFGVSGVPVVDMLRCPRRYDVLDYEIEHTAQKCIDELLESNGKKSETFTALKNAGRNFNVSIAIISLLFGLAYNNDAASTKLMRSITFAAPKMRLEREDYIIFVDPHRFSDPDPVHAFTCWDQSRNCRGDNIGSHIDYILVENELAHRAMVIDTIFVQKTEDDERISFAEEFITRCRSRIEYIMGNGFYALADRFGNGLPECTSETAMVPFCKKEEDAKYLTHSTEVPVDFAEYFNTPPQFSDHIGISTVLNISSKPFPREINQSKDSKNSQIIVSETGLNDPRCSIQHCTYKRKTATLTSFFNFSSVASNSEKTQVQITKEEKCSDADSTIETVEITSENSLSIKE